LRDLRFKRLLTRRSVLAMGAGLGLALAFPKANLAGTAWLAPGLMLLAAVGAPPRRAFRLGYVSGLAYALVSFHWLLFIPFPAGAVAGWLALSVYVALYPATWVWLCWKVFPRPPVVLSAGATPSANRPGEEGTPSLSAEQSSRWRLLARILATSWRQRTLWAITCAAGWVGLEVVLGRLLSGFPWNFLGVSQYAALPLIQVASWTGVYGVSFLVAWVSVGLLVAAVQVAGLMIHPTLGEAGCERPGDPSRASWSARVPHPLGAFRLVVVGDLALPVLGLALVVAFGIGRLVHPVEEERHIKLALVQPSIPQRLIFDSTETAYRFERLMELSRLALAAKPDLLVWPEASLPGLDETNYQAMSNLISSHRVSMIFGADDAERRSNAEGTGGWDIYNSAFLFDGAGRYVATYRKQQLVIFGEYIPLAKWLPLTKYLTPIEGSFTPGKGPAPFELAEPPAKVSVLICFEDVFPHLVRDYVERDTDFLLNLTNNGWFGESAAQWQHAVNAVFRAVENGLPLVRCANNGLTCWVDAQGRMHAVGFNDPADIYSAGFKSVEVPLLPAGQKRPPTFYRRYGDWFGWGCAAWTVAAWMILRPRSYRPR
jgi:apolipoprotein N-acyltransferase